MQSPRPPSARRMGTRHKASFAAALLASCLTGTALAHPFGDRDPGQRLDVAIHPDEIRVGLVVELPQGLADGASNHLQALALARGVVVTLDGSTLQTTIVATDHRVDLLAPTVTIYELTLSAPAALSGVHDLEISNGNLIGIPGWYLDEVRLGAGIWLRSSSLRIERRDGGYDDLGGRWSRSELRRRVQLTVDAPADLPHRFFRWVEGPAMRTPAEATTEGFAHDWLAGQVTPATVAAIVSWSGLAAVVLAAALPNAVTGLGIVLLGGVVGAVAGAWLGPPVALAGAAALAIASSTVPGIFTAAALMALALMELATVPWWAAISTAWLCGALVGVNLPRLQPRPRVVLVLLLLGAAVSRS